jgi:Trypsin-like peptidase domain
VRGTEHAPFGVARLLAGSEPRGTAFLVSNEHALTAFHCVGDRTTGEVDVADFSLRFDQPSVIDVPVTVDKVDTRLDVARLRLQGLPPSGVSPLPLGAGAGALERYRAFGFSLMSTGVSVHTASGTVTVRTHRREDGAPVLGLYSQEAAAGLLLRGLSGGPVLAGSPERVIGVIRWQEPDPADQERAYGGTFYATPIGEIPWVHAALRPDTYRALLIGDRASAGDNAAMTGGVGAGVRLLASVLTLPDIGLYTEVREVIDGRAADVEAALRDFFAGAAAGDQLIVYFTGRAWEDPDGRVRFAMRDTSGDVHSLSDKDVIDLTEGCRARGVLFLLDLVVTGEVPVNRLAGPGRAVLANQVPRMDVPDVVRPSTFTWAVADTILSQGRGDNTPLFLLGDLKRGLEHRKVPATCVDPAGSKPAVARTWRSSARSLTLWVTPPSAGGRRHCRYDVVIDNTGRQPVDVALTTSETGLRLRLARTRLVVAPRSRERVALRTTTRRPPGPSWRGHSFVVTAETVGWRRSVPGLFAQRRRMVPMGPVLFVAGLLSVGLAALLITFVVPGGPEPDRFEVSVGDQIAPGRPGPGAGTLEEAGSTDVYSFTTEPGQVTLHVEEPDCTAGPPLQLTLDEQSAGIFGCEADLPLAGPGDHELSVSSLCGGMGGPSCTGTYRLRLSTED